MSVPSGAMTQVETDMEKLERKIHQNGKKNNKKKKNETDEIKYTFNTFVSIFHYFAHSFVNHAHLIKRKKS